jgi:3-hydroxyisobutyrate dehydrogenase
MRTVVFLGTGTMGMPMARNLLDAGFQVRAWNRTSARAAPLAEHGAQVFDDPGEAADGCDLLVTMLSDAAAVLGAASAALGGARRPATWLQTSTIGLEGLEHCVELAERFEATLVDSPVLGTREPAEQGKLVVLASGPDSALNECEPVFDAIGSRTLRLGEAGAGTRCKLVVNSWILGLTGVLAETISLAEVLGLDPDTFFAAIEGGPVDVPYARMKGRAMIEKAFDDASFRLSLARKDADLVRAAAENARLEVPVIRAVADRLARAERAGHGDEDMAATYWATATQLATARDA